MHANREAGCQTCACRQGGRLSDMCMQTGRQAVRRVHADRETGCQADRQDRYAGGGKKDRRATDRQDNTGCQEDEQESPQTKKTDTSVDEATGIK